MNATYMLHFHHACMPCKRCMCLQTGWTCLTRAERTKHSRQVLCVGLDARQAQLAPRMRKGSCSARPISHCIWPLAVSRLSWKMASVKDKAYIDKAGKRGIEEMGTINEKKKREKKGTKQTNKRNGGAIAITMQHLEQDPAALLLEVEQRIETQVSLSLN